MDHKIKKTELGKGIKFEDAWSEDNGEFVEQSYQSLKIENEKFSMTFTYYENNLENSFGHLTVRMKKSNQELDITLLAEELPKFYTQAANETYYTDEMTAKDVFKAQQAYTALQIINSVK